MKRRAAISTLILVLVIFPVVGSGAFADLIGATALPLNLLAEPWNMFLFGIGLVICGSSLRKI